jgi:hypothetical protein
MPSRQTAVDIILVLMGGYPGTMENFDEMALG